MAETNTRLWFHPEVTIGERLGLALLATGEKGCWRKVDTDSGRGWIWQGRIEGCPE